MGALLKYVLYNFSLWVASQMYLLTFALRTVADRNGY